MKELLLGPSEANAASQPADADAMDTDTAVQPSKPAQQQAAQPVQLKGPRKGFPASAAASKTTAATQQTAADTEAADGATPAAAKQPDDSAGAPATQPAAVQPDSAADADATRLLLQAAGLVDASTDRAAAEAAYQSTPQPAAWPREAVADSTAAPAQPAGSLTTHSCMYPLE